MQISNTTSKLVKPLIPLLKKCGGVSHKTSKEKATLRKAQMKIFHDIRKGDEYVDKLVKTCCFEPSISAVREVPKTYASRYFPVEIKKSPSSNSFRRKLKAFLFESNY